MSIYPVNKFNSSIHPGISVNSGNPTVIWDDNEVVGAGYALVTSIICANKTDTPKKYSVILEKITSTGTDAAYLLYEIIIPANTSYEAIAGNQFILKEGDQLKAYSEGIVGSTTGVIDVTISWVTNIPPSE